MNDTLQLLQTHRSVRSYADTPVDEAALAQIIETGRRSPSSFNAQHLSVVVVRAAAARTRIAELAGGQPWIARAPVFIVVAADAGKTAAGVAAAGAAQQAHRSAELVVACSIDAGIALGAMMAAARAQGLAVVPVGGIRRNPRAMIDLLGLPPLTFPLCGMCVGHAAADAPLKPRLPTQAFRHDERYDADAVRAAIPAYDQAMLRHWRDVGRPDGASWSATLAEHYSRDYFPGVGQALREQGFEME